MCYTLNSMHIGRQIQPDRIESRHQRKVSSSWFHDTITAAGEIIQIMTAMKRARQRPHAGQIRFSSLPIALKWIPH